MKRVFLVFLLVLFTLLTACTRHKIAASSKPLVNGRYDTEFPSRNVSGEIEKITRSVKKVFSVSSYTTYQFRREDRITTYRLQQGSFKQAAWGVISTNETVSGTATILGSINSRISLLTCAHIVTSPDTLIGYYEATNEEPLRYIQRISIKESQENWIKDLSACGAFKVIAADNDADIAILGNKCEALSDSISQFPYPAGHAKELGWGSFVYVLGYPLGNQMITTGVVSPSPKRPMGEFSVDALLNKGYSGGIILAVRGGVPNFEITGMVKTVNSTREEFLKPSTDGQLTPDWIPYKGDMYVGKSDYIQYGLNVIVPFESIVAFYKKNRQALLSEGYNLDNFFQLK